MYKIMNEYLSKVSLQSGETLRLSLYEHVKSMKEVRSFSVVERAKQYIIDMNLVSFSVEEAEKAFRKLQEKIAYAYSSFYIRYNEGKCVRYRFVTCREDKNGLYCDMIFR